VPPLTRRPRAPWGGPQQLHTARQLAARLPTDGSPHAPTRRRLQLPRWHASFRHLASYGAGYYTYLWARSLSARIWHSLFFPTPLERTAGERWCDAVLRHGGAREPRSLLRELLSVPPTTPSAGYGDARADEQMGQKANCPTARRMTEAGADDQLGNGVSSDSGSTTAAERAVAQLVRL